MAAPWLVLALFVCPDGAVVDRLEGDALVVLGAWGVRVIAADHVLAPGTRPAREGDRLVATPSGRCRAEAPFAADVRRVRERLRALERRGRRPGWTR